MEEIKEAEIKIETAVANIRNGFKLIDQMDSIFKSTNNKYSRGKIYKIIGGGLTYYGSTCNTVTKRLLGHQSDYRKYQLDVNHGYTTSFKILEQEKCYIKLVENYPFNNKKELLAREGYYIRNNDCVNKVIAGRTAQQYAEDNKAKISAKNKKYRDENVETITEYKKQYYEDNKDNILQQNKQYYIDNQANIREKKKQYRKVNKDKIKARRSQVCTCECGIHYQKINKSSHMKSKRHQNYINNQ